MTSENNIIKLRYDGGNRFKDAKLPVDVLPDLPAFRDLLLAFAKNEWKKTHKDRVRVPRGFDRSFSFDLTNIERGSAIPWLKWDRHSVQEQLPGFNDEFNGLIEISVKNIACLFDNAANDIFPDVIDAESIRALNKFGAGLRDNEKIEFLGSLGRDGNTIYVDSYRRKKLLTRVRPTYERRIDGTGELIEVGKSFSSEAHIKIRTEDYGTLELKVEQERLKEFDGHIEEFVQYDVLALLDSSDVVREISYVYDVGLIFDPIENGVFEEIDRLDDLIDGWADGTGKKITRKAISCARDIVNKTRNISRSYKIFPREEGGILFDFELNGWDLSIEISECGIFELYGIQIDGDNFIDPIQFESVSEVFLDKLKNIGGNL